MLNKVFKSPPHTKFKNLASGSLSVKDTYSMANKIGKLSYDGNEGGGIVEERACIK